MAALPKDASSQVPAPMPSSSQPPVTPAPPDQTPSSGLQSSYGNRVCAQRLTFRNLKNEVWAEERQKTLGKTIQREMFPVTEGHCILQVHCLRQTGRPSSGPFVLSPRVSHSLGLITVP